MTASHGDEVPGGQLEGTSSLSQSSDTGDKDDKIPQSPTIRQDRIENKPMSNGLNAKTGDGGRPTSPQTAGTASSDVVRKRIAAIDDENGNKTTKQPPKKEKPALRKGKWTVRTNLMGLSTKYLQLITQLFYSLLTGGRRRVYFTSHSTLQCRLTYSTRWCNAAIVPCRQAELRSNADHKEVHRGMLLRTSCVSSSRTPEGISTGIRNS